jgi:hypothetical protein
MAPTPSRRRARPGLAGLGPQTPHFLHPAPGMSALVMRIPGRLEPLLLISCGLLESLLYPTLPTLVVVSILAVSGDKPHGGVARGM